MRRLNIPADLGYCDTDAGGVIPPNATLLFGIELMVVSTPASLGRQHRQICYMHG